MSWQTTLLQAHAETDTSRLQELVWQCEDQIRTSDPPTPFPSELLQGLEELLKIKIERLGYPRIV